MSSSDIPFWSSPFTLARSTAGVPWSPSQPVVRLFGHLLKTKELIDQLSYWAAYDFSSNNKSPPTYWREFKPILAQSHNVFLFFNYLMIKIAYSILHSGYSYRHNQAYLEIFWDMANEQFEELTRLLKKSEEDTFKALQLRPPTVRDKPIPVHQSGVVGIELMPTFLEILTRDDLFTGCAARVEDLTNNVQRVLQDKGDYTMPPEMNDAEFHEVLTKVAHSSSATRNSRHPRRKALATPDIGKNRQQSIYPVAGMNAMSLGNETAGPTEGEIQNLLEYAEQSNRSETRDRTSEVPPKGIQSVKYNKPVVLTPSESQLRTMRSHRALIVVENESIDENSEDSEDSTEK